MAFLSRQSIGTGAGSLFVKKWGEVWDVVYIKIKGSKSLENKNISSDSIVYKHLPGIVSSIVSNLTRSKKWCNKQQAASALSEVLAIFTSRTDDRLLMQRKVFSPTKGTLDVYTETLLNALKENISGIVWAGKEEALLALSNMCSNFPEEVYRLKLNPLLWIKRDFKRSFGNNARFL